ncbi:MAG: hypothetical protein JO086_06960, partial [Acidimicrobiia bacterium]|nr:hypothetical protein [Acidimicrobiia bacterium]
MHVFSHGLSPLVVNEQRALHVAADVALILMIVATLRCVFALLLGRVGTAFAAFWMFGFAALFFGDYGPDAVRWGARAVDATGARGAMSLVVLIAVGVVSWRGAMRLARLVATLVARASFLLCRKLGPLLETVAQRQRARRAALASALAP